MIKKNIYKFGVLAIFGFSFLPIVAFGATIDTNPIIIDNGSPQGLITCNIIGQEFNNSLYFFNPDGSPVQSNDCISVNLGFNFLPDVAYSILGTYTMIESASGFGGNLYCTEEGLFPTALENCQANGTSYEPLQNEIQIVVMDSTPIIINNNFMFSVPTSTASDLTANITSQFADAGTLAVVVLVAGIPLAFYVIKKLIALIPKK